MKKPRKENAALAALRVGLGTAKFQTASLAQVPHEDGGSTSVESNSDGEAQSQPQYNLPHDHGDSIEDIENTNTLESNNPINNASPEAVRPLVTTGFKRFIGQVVEVPVELLRVEDNVRTQVIENENFGGLVGTIEDVGLLQNLLVQLTILPDGAEDLLIISGQRRWVASRKAKKRTVPCKIIEGLDRKSRILYGLIENQVREELSPIDIGFAYRQLVDELGTTQEELAQTFKCTKKTIQRYLSLTTWPKTAIEMLRQHPGLFSTDFLFNGISGDILSDPDLLVLRLRKKIDQANDSASGQQTLQNSKSQKTSDSELTKWNQTACQNLGVPVKISGTRDNLRITIRCSGDENVKRVLDRLGVGSD
jgi:ParB family chromosome partitioning protein